jgi:hypothetical protein
MTSFLLQCSLWHNDRSTPRYAAAASHPSTEQHSTSDHPKKGNLMLLTPAITPVRCCFCVSPPAAAAAAAAAGWHSTGAVNVAVAPAGNFRDNGRRLIDSWLRPVQASGSTKEYIILDGVAAGGSAGRNAAQQQEGRMSCVLNVGAGQHGDVSSQQLTNLQCSAA